MKQIPGERGLALLLILASAVFYGCQAVTNTPCTVNATVVPQAATADHTQQAPGNQVTFSTSVTVGGNCVSHPLDKLGSWSTSDATDISISTISQVPHNAQALATCLHATLAPVTISFDGIESGYTFTSATLTCK